MQGHEATREPYSYAIRYPAAAASRERDDYEPPPPSYAILTLVTSLFFLSPFGWIAWSFGSKVDKLWEEGDREGARRMSNNAKALALIGIALPVGGALLLGVFVGVDWISSNL